MLAKKLRFFIFTAIFILLFFAVFSYFSQNLNSENAYASDGYSVATISASFAYDGNTHYFKPSLTGFSENATFTWTKNNNVVSNSYALAISHVSQSGTYELSATENDVTRTGTVTVSVLPVMLYASWHTANSATATEYKADKPFTYNGVLQSVYPIPKGMITGDKLTFDVINNSAKDVGSYRAKITAIKNLDGTVNSDYYLDDGYKYKSYTINKATLSVVAPDLEISFGDEIVFDSENLVFDGFFGGDDTSDLGEIQVVSSDYKVGYSIGEYTTEISCVSDNYSLNITKGKLTVIPRKVNAIFYNSTSVYGEKIEYDYQIFGFSSLITQPTIDISIPSAHVGVYAISASITSRNYEFEFTPAIHEITTRNVEYDVATESVYYGDTPVLSLIFTSGSLADGDTASDLNLAHTPLPKAVGTMTLTVQENSPDYSAPDTTFLVEVLPKKVSVRVLPVVAVYGENYVMPSAELVSELAYDDTLSDLELEFSKEQGFGVGVYQLTAKSLNSRYEVTVTPSTYRVAPRTLTVYTVISSNLVIKDGESISFEPTIQGKLDYDDVSVVFSYGLLNEYGTVSETVDVIEKSGNYAIFAKTVGENVSNYELNFLQKDKKFSIYSDKITTDACEIQTYSGFTPSVTVTTVALDSSVFAEKYEKITDFQSIIGAYEIKVDTDDQFMQIKLRVNDEKRHYTVGIEKADGTVTYVACDVADGYAVFTTDTANTRFILWQDKEPTPYVVTFIVLFIALMAEIAVFSTLLKRYRGRKSRAYAFVPFVGALSLFLGGIYVFFALSVIEFVLCVILLVAILVVNKKINRLKKSGN